MAIVDHIQKLPIGDAVTYYNAAGGDTAANYGSVPAVWL